MRSHSARASLQSADGGRHVCRLTAFIATGLVVVFVGIFVQGMRTDDQVDFPCPDCKLLWLNDGLEATTAVVQSAVGKNILYSNGKAIMPGALPRRALTPFLLAPNLMAKLALR